jgi:hypothetical protein
MLVKISNGSSRFVEWCILEFQGEMVADELEGKDLGSLDVMPVRDLQWI